jgi:hypothetical protein
MLDDTIHTLCLGGNLFYCPSRNILVCCCLVRRTNDDHVVMTACSRSEDGADPLNHDTREAGQMRDSLVSTSVDQGMEAHPIEAFEEWDETVPSLLVCDCWNSQIRT